MAALRGASSEDRLNIRIRCTEDVVGGLPLIARWTITKQYGQWLSLESPPAARTTFFSLQELTKMYISSAQPGNVLKMWWVAEGGGQQKQLLSDGPDIKNLYV